MGDTKIFSRLISNFAYDILHLDFEIIRIYLEFLKNCIMSKLSSKPDLSSEIFHWKRYYHQCVRENPSEPIFKRGEITKKSILDSIEYLRAIFECKLFCLDVGCGPTSQFYTQDFIDQEDVQITCVDPLADIYNELHKKYPSGYDIDCITGYGEELSKLFSRDYFHLVYSQNALDHCQNPQEFIKNIYLVLKPEGILVLHGFIKEGTAAHWLGLHQWDIEVDNSDLLLTNRNLTIDHENLTAKFNLKIINKIVEGNNIGDMYTLIYTKK